MTIVLVYIMVVLILQCNYMELATESADCIYSNELDACASCSGEQDGTGFILDNDADDDGVCDADEVLGCKDSNAWNFNIDATDDDGSCDYNSTYLGSLECGVTLSTSLDTLSGNCNNNYNAPSYEVYSFTLDSTSTVEMSFDMNAWECWCYNENYVKVLLFENGYLVDWWEEYASSCYGNASNNIPSEIVLSAGDYQVLYGGNTSLFIYEGLAIEDAVDEFTLTNNPYETVSVEMSLSINPDIFYDCNNECLYDLDGDGICDELELPEMILYDLPDSIVYSYTVEDSILANESFSLAIQEKETF